MQKMMKMKKLAWLMLALAPGAQPAWAADDAVAKRLVDQARYWQQKNREDLAADAWRKLLRAEPNHPVALIQLGAIEARAGRFKEAEALYARASALTPAPSGLSELETALKVGRAPAAQLSTVRKQAQAGQAQEAVKGYRGILGESKPAGQFGLEYYQTLGATREGWDEARRGLEELARNNPGDTRYLLALARHLTYRETTRREGIRQLATLAQRDPAAQKAWRQALVWLGARPNDRGLFLAYLGRYPDDQGVTERLRLLDRPAVVYRPNPQDLARQAGFKLLEQGEIDEAEKRFRAVLEKSPRDPDALGGLGTIRLRQEAFDEAARLLEQAVQFDKRGSARWKQARDSARYWALMQDVIDARQAGRLAEMEGKLQQALKIDNREPTGQVMMADLLSERRDFTRAEALYRQVLKAAPLDPGAFRGLVALLIQSGRDREAMTMVSSLDEASALKVGGLNQAKAAAMLKLAESEEQARNYESAAEKLEDALLLDPLNPWVRLALARQYQKLGDPGGANALLDNLLDTNPDLPEALHARALLFAEQQRWWEGLMTLERIPAAARSAAMARDQRRLWVNVQVQRALQFHAQGNAQRAGTLMAQAESAAGAAQDVSLLAVVAGGWTELAQATRALRVMREIAGRAPPDNLGVRIQYAGILLTARQDAELSAVLRELAGSDRLTPAQQEDLNKIILAYTLRQTDSLREAGRLADAYDAVAPALEQSDDPRLIMALARIYNSGGDPVQALELAESVIVREPDDLEHRLFASGVALGARAPDKAAGHARAALELAPDHPRALAAAGRAEKARGDLAKAMEYFQYAQALEREKGAFAGAPGNLSLRLVDENPAAAPTATVIAGRTRRTGLLPVPDAARRSGRQPTPAYDVGSEAAYQAYPVTPAANPFARPESRASVLPVPGSSYNAPQPRYQTPVTRALPPLSAADAYERVQYADPVGNYGNDDFYEQPEALAVSRPIMTSRRAAPEYLDAPLIAPRPAPVRYADPVRVAVTPTTVQAVPMPARERTITDEIGDIKLKYTTTLDLGSGFRRRSGDSGLNRLTEAELPIELKIPVDYDGAVTLRLTPVMLSAGTLNLSDPRVAARFGSNALGPILASPYASTKQDESGIAFSAGYRSENFAADLGTTPQGFRRANIVGGITYADRFDDFNLRGTLSRRAVTDSLLSYAGARDPLSGDVWGGVVKSGGKIDVGYGDDSAGVYAAAGFSVLTGRGVQTNNEIEGTLGGYWRAYQSPDTRVTLGVNLTALAYRDNLGFFTLGHGGYFSPQSYFSIGIPMDIAGRKGKLSYQVGGDIGIRHFKQDRAPYFPGNPGMQSLWENQLAATPGLAGYAAYYNGESVTGLGYNLYGSFEYLLAPKFALGGRMAFDNSRNYAQQAGMVYLRYAFDGMPQPVPFPPRTLRPLSLGDQQ